MLKKKKIIFILVSLVFILIISGIFYYPTYKKNYYWKEAKKMINTVKAWGGCPTELGIMNVVLIQCALSDGSCQGLGAVLCPSATACNTTQEVKGAMAGGSGNMALFSNIMIGQAGVSPGGSLLACVSSPTMTDGGTLAGVGGCTGPGCAMIKKNPIERTIDWFKDIFIAGSREQ